MCGLSRGNQCAAGFHPCREAGDKFGSECAAATAKDKGSVARKVYPCGRLNVYLAQGDVVGVAQQQPQFAYVCPVCPPAGQSGYGRLLQHADVIASQVDAGEAETIDNGVDADVCQCGGFGHQLVEFIGRYSLIMHGNNDCAGQEALFAFIGLAFERALRHAGFHALVLQVVKSFRG
ncbi:hypothetical protein Barb7_00914 [Bacteroidales bacterium Barb7]|nr:hypothetical protein Barb7_00914 [Bacteroidales bacterium Barb7]